MKKTGNLNDLIIGSLRDMYHSEQQLTKLLPKMMRHATSEKLSRAMKLMISRSESHINRLEDMFKIVSIPERGRKSEGIEGLLAETRRIMDENPPSSIADAALISAAQKILHYEIANYGALSSWTTELGMTTLTNLIDESLEEEKETDRALTDLAESHINSEASAQQLV